MLRVCRALRMGGGGEGSDREKGETDEWNGRGKKVGWRVGKREEG